MTQAGAYLADTLKVPYLLDGSQLLMFAIEKGHIGIVPLLIQAGATFGDEKINGDSPLVWAARNGHAKIVRLLI